MHLVPNPHVLRQPNTKNASMDCVDSIGSIAQNGL